jgi:hypothetical protein
MKRRTLSFRQGIRVGVYSAIMALRHFVPEEQPERVGYDILAFFD